jgi:hypothetical protein
METENAVFTPTAGTPVEAISLIRAKERVQAALAEVAFRQGGSTTRLDGRGGDP